VACTETCWVRYFLVVSVSTSRDIGWPNNAIYGINVRNPGLDFVASPALQPPEVAVDAELMRMYQADLEKVCTAPNPAISILTHWLVGCRGAASGGG